MTLPPLPLVNNSLYVSSSFLSTLTCPRSTEYYKLHNRVLDSSGAGLNFGSVLHSALEMWYRLQEFSLSEDERISRCTRLMEKEFQALPESDDFRNLNWANDIFAKYREVFRHERWKLMQFEKPKTCSYCCHGLVLIPNTDGGTERCEWCNGTGFYSIMTEVSFAVKLFDYEPEDKEVFFAQTGLFRFPVIYHGFIDLVVSLDSRPFLLDFKTTSMLGKGFWDDKLMSAQPRGYCWALKKTTDLDCAGYIIRAIRTTPMPPGIKNGKENRKGVVTTQENWWKEGLCDENFILQPDDLLEWEQNTIAKVKQFMYHYEQGYFPRNTETCTSKFGRCQYFDVCSTNLESRHAMLYSGQYKNKEKKEIK